MNRLYQKYQSPESELELRLGSITNSFNAVLSDKKYDKLSNYFKINSSNFIKKEQTTLNIIYNPDKKIEGRNQFIETYVSMVVGKFEANAAFNSLKPLIVS